MIERLPVRVPAQAVGEFSSPELTPVLPQWHLKDPRSLCAKYRWQVILEHAYPLDPTKSEWADYAALQHSVGTYQEKRAHTQLVREHSATVVSAR